MKWADEITIDTPEQVDLDLEVAGLGSRLIAQLTDWFYKWSLWLILFLVTLLLMSLAGIQGIAAGIVLGVLALSFVVFLFGYDVYFEVYRNGQTPGKRKAGIRVIRDGGAPVDFTASCVRNCVAIVDFLPFGYILGGFVAMLNKRAQRLGDMAAGTIVIRERVSSRPPEVVERLSTLASNDIHFSASQLAACTSLDRHVLRSYFERSSQMDFAPRERLVVKLAEQFSNRMGLIGTAPIYELERAEAFLASLLRDLDAVDRQQGL